MYYQVLILISNYSGLCTNSSGEKRLSTGEEELLNDAPFLVFVEACGEVKVFPRLNFKLKQCLNEMHIIYKGMK